MQLPLQDFATLVRNMAAGVQGACLQLVDLTTGSVLRAVLEANASVALWMQWLMVQIATMTRAATSNGADLDSWKADFSVTRLAAVPASGAVTFSRFTPGLAALVPVGTLVRTADGTQTYTVLSDSSNAAWNASANGYTIAAAATSVMVPVQATTPGVAGNVQPGAVTLLVSPIPGVDTVGNALVFTGGLDPEADVALRARFQNYMNSRARATIGAISYAIASVQQGLSFTILENIDATGAFRPGNFMVTVDDGSGAPPAALITAVNAAVDLMRPIGSTFTVSGPSVLTSNISLAVSVSAASQKAAAVSAISAAMTAWVNQLPIGMGLSLSRIAQIAYAASSAVTNVSQVQINGQFADLDPGVTGVVKVGTIMVS